MTELSMALRGRILYRVGSDDAEAAITAGPALYLS
jgi:hypothetical protein